MITDVADEKVALKKGGAAVESTAKCPYGGVQGVDTESSEVSQVRS